jgi:hypothetical protein
MDVKAKEDLEAFALETLEKGIVRPLKGKSRNMAERTAIIAALVTYSDTAEGRATIKKVKTALTAEMGQAANAVERENLRSMLKLFK